MLRKIYFILTPSGRRIARRLFYLPTDCFNILLNRSDSLIPPKGKSFVGSGNFKNIGDKFFKHIVETTDIDTDSTILDIGSGIGRIARPFTYFLSKKSKYIGFDIIDYGINWCNKKYKKYPNFSFECYPLKNDLYNLSANKNASEFVFPYNDNTFNLVILTSVFTHMQKDEVTNYLQQIFRVMKPGAYCYATFFLILPNDDQSLFPYEFEDYSLHNMKIKNANVAYKKDFIMNTIGKIGYSHFQSFEGWWKTGFKADKVDFQDVIILQKPDK